jgi:hypothetical protein
MKLRAWLAPATDEARFRGTTGPFLRNWSANPRRRGRKPLHRRELPKAHGTAEKARDNDEHLACELEANIV